ncbi:MAG: hypothetical protein K2L02_00960, partial [Clostridia bacterium]|nr:hypothetical protein [Clostridia bacterium]
MSGRGKRTLYYCVTAICLLAAISACILMAYSVYLESQTVLYTVFSFLLFCGVYVLFSPCVLVHECGHLIFGACARMKPVSVLAGNLYIEGKKVRFAFSSAAGKTEFVPLGGNNVRGRMMASSLGGAAFNFLIGIIFTALFFALPANPVLLFFELFAPLHLYEGIAAILPAQLDSGRTDGELFRQLKNDTAEAKVFVNVLTAQGILLSGTFDKVDEELLFDTPVVREDDPAFLSLLHLRWQYLMWKGETERAKKELSRLIELKDYLDERAASDIECDGSFMRRIT